MSPPSGMFVAREKANWVAHYLRQKKYTFFFKHHFLYFPTRFWTLDHKLKKMSENYSCLLGPIFRPKLEDLSIQIYKNFLNFAHPLYR